jgi:predicted XRE-type DNA-binding protein
MQRSNDHYLERESKQDQLEVGRFIKSITQYLITKKLSQRKGCEGLEITNWNDD